MFRYERDSWELDDVTIVLNPKPLTLEASPQLSLRNAAEAIKRVEKAEVEIVLRTYLLSLTLNTPPVGGTWKKDK